jgi:thioredoxin reductase (NADPH)
MMMRAMGESILFVIDDNQDRLDAVSAALRRRYGQDYVIATETSPSAAFRCLTDWQQAERSVALIMVAAFMTTANGPELLAQARGLHPAAKRVLLVPGDGPDAPSLRVPAQLLKDRTVAQPVLRALAFGFVDSYLPAPGAPEDEAFHRGITELLEEWTHTVTPDRPAVRIIGDDQSPRCNELRGLLARNSIPYLFLPADTNEGQRWLQQVAKTTSPLPVAIFYTGETLVDPTNDQIAEVFGLSTLPSTSIDVAIIGAGPAGLSAAVYTASEGASTLLLEREAIGGQAGSSSLIRNYLGFPRGISGANLATRAFEQAWSFGATTSLAGPATALVPTSDGYTIKVASGQQVHARAVVVATGVSYRQLVAPGLNRFTGAGVFYGSIASEASAFSDQHVFIVGAANSAGQAAINLARHAAQVTIVARADSLAARMSQYLIDQIYATPNIDVRTNTQIAGADGDGKLETLTLADTTTGSTETVPASALFVLIGAVPHTDWLPETLARDQHGFIITGNDLGTSAPDERDRLAQNRLPFETSLRGVFAAGDVRHGSIKRVASAVGEGSIAGSLIVQYIQLQETGPS